MAATPLSRIAAALVSATAVAGVSLAVLTMVDRPFSLEIQVARGSISPLNASGMAFLIALMVLGMLTSLVQRTLKPAFGVIALFVILGYGSANYLDLLDRFLVDSDWSGQEYVVSALEVALISVCIGILAFVAGTSVAKIVREAVGLIRRRTGAADPGSTRRP